jgi:hypothetical protein
MNKIREILKYLELTSWAIAFFIVIMSCFQILNTVFVIGGTVNSEQVLVRIYLSLLFLVLPLVVKGARHAYRSV